MRVATQGNGRKEGCPCGKAKARRGEKRVSTKQLSSREGERQREEEEEAAAGTMPFSCRLCQASADHFCPLLTGTGSAAAEMWGKEQPRNSLLAHEEDSTGRHIQTCLSIRDT
ncbi:hypothetical protein OYC64_011105 [Pagothenia borchgrevinki]|uniref:Uncharacterized protein n=1 Tax=Pagothenia borchgrevinki TaxID=8213 RepID=A0ABD2GY69_PAGBO